MAGLRNVVLTGFMGTGKSSIGPLLARRLGFRFLDTDEQISQREGRSITDIFEQDGESHFRQLERDMVRELGAASGCVIATGGGTLLIPENRAMLEACGPVVCLQASAEVLAQRLVGKTHLPLLPEEGRAEAIARLLEERDYLYRSLPLRLDTSGLSIAECCDRIAELTGLEEVAVGFAPERCSYPVVLRRGLLNDAEAWRLQCEGASKVVIITDQNVAPLYARPLSNMLQQLGIEAPLLSFPAGEHHKSFQTLGELLTEMAGLRLDRKAPVLAVGGGVVGDVAALAASLYMRGLRLIQVPTSLLAMVDAAVGGKTAIDLAGVKNLVGSYHQPEAVLVDVSALKTLPPVELSSGIAEMIKSGLIADPGLFELLEQQAARLLELDLDIAEDLVRRCVKVKAEIVSRDPLEGGLRRVLNLGHTIGHALEADSGFVLLTHGQAVGLGMLCAAWIGKRLGLTAGGLQVRLRTLLLKAGLPVTHAMSRPQRLLDFVHLDKKVSTQGATMILPVKPGEVLIREGIEDKLIMESLEAITP
ncbi:3-dehydroquinate synthase [bacterium]|nr:3-dehydroquinate synthase [bacterium]